MSRSLPNTAAAHLPQHLTPFDAVSDMELERLVLLYAHEALKAAAGDGDDTGDEMGRTRAEWEERQALYAELHAAKGLPFTPEPFPETCGISLATLERKRNKAVNYLSALPHFMTRQDIAPVLSLARAYLERHGIDAGGVDHHRQRRFRRSCLALMQEEHKVQSAILQRLDGQWVPTPTIVAVPEISPPPPHAAAVDARHRGKDAAGTGHGCNDALAHGPDNPRFKALWEGYLAERKPLPATIRNFAPAIRRFTELVGDLPIRAITKSHIR